MDDFLEGTCESCGREQRWARDVTLRTCECGEALIKVIVPLSFHWDARCQGERLWARVLGGDRYELMNVPFHAYGLHRGDVV